MIRWTLFDGPDFSSKRFPSNTRSSQWGSGGSPFRFDPKTLDCHDRSGTRVKLIGHTRAVLQQLARLKPDVRIAISSKTDEPSWARECLALIEVEPGLKFKDVLDEVVISKKWALFLWGHASGRDLIRSLLVLVQLKRQTLRTHSTTNRDRIRGHDLFRQRG